MHYRVYRKIVFFSALIIMTVFGSCAQIRGQVQLLSATTVPENQQIQPPELIRLLQSRNADRPLLLQVGSRVMFEQAHIPGSVYAGPGSQEAGLHLLETKVASAPKDKLIVIYCGCCPWNRCPNMGPAYKRLHDLGFTNIKALYIAKNFGDDWVAQGYPVEKGE